jgi:hypothetical protein
LDNIRKQDKEGARRAVPLRTNPGERDSVVPGQGDGSHADLANAIIGAVCLASHGAVYDEMTKFKVVREREMAKALRSF